MIWKHSFASGNLLISLFASALRPIQAFGSKNPTSLSSSVVQSRLHSTTTTSSSMASSTASTATEDPYLWLEDVESERSLDFAKASNAACLAKLGDPKKTPTRTYDRILAVLESDDRIPAVSQFGVNPQGEPVLFNFWKDSKNPKGLWRKTTLASYAQPEAPSVQWETVLDVDALAEKDGVSWVFKGSTPLPRARDRREHQQLVSRALLSLSRGGSDAVHIKEFDLVKGDFVSGGNSCSASADGNESDTAAAFDLPEAKTRASYKSRDVLLVGSDFGPDSLTDSGYPRTVREWVRGTPLAEAPVVFEGESKDVSVGVYISDERVWGDADSIYEVRYRSLTFYTTKYWVRKLKPEHLLAPDDPARVGVEEPPEFVAVDISEDASISFLGKMLIISLRSDWEPKPGTKFQRGSVILTQTDEFLAHGAAGTSEYTPLFEPTERTAYEYYTATKNYLILSTMDNVKSKLSFFKIVDGGSKVVPVVTAAEEAQIRDCNVRPVDPYSDSDEFWFTTSDFTTPSTLYLADAAKVVETNESSSPDRQQADSFITKQLKSLPPQYNSSNLTVEQRIAVSADGTEIPYFIVMKKDIVLDGNNPTLLYGYGGFEVSLGPHYIATAGLA